jgi:hypothetical protein
MISDRDELSQTQNSWTARKRCSQERFGLYDDIKSQTQDSCNSSKRKAVGKTWIVSQTLLQCTHTKYQGKQTVNNCFTIADPSSKLCLLTEWKNYYHAEDLGLLIRTIQITVLQVLSPKLRYLIALNTG